MQSLLTLHGCGVSLKKAETQMNGTATIVPEVMNYASLIRNGLVNKACASKVALAIAICIRGYSGAANTRQVLWGVVVLKLELESAITRVQ